MKRPPPIYGVDVTPRLEIVKTTLSPETRKAGSRWVRSTKLIAKLKDERG